jgi:formiminotetrahydrofolate cyclodeaminase
VLGSGSAVVLVHVRTALSGAADVLLRIAGADAEVAEVAARSPRKGNTNPRGDAFMAVLLAEAGTRSAAALMQINTSAGDFSGDTIERADELASKAAEAALWAVEDNG